MDNTGLLYDKSGNLTLSKAESHTFNLITRELLFREMNTRTRQ